MGTDGASSVSALRRVPKKIWIPAVVLAMGGVFAGMTIAPSEDSAMTTCSLAMPPKAVQVSIEWAWWTPGWQCTYLDSSGRVLKVIRPSEVDVKD